MTLCNNKNLQKFLDDAVFQGFLTNKAAKSGINHSTGFLFSQENSFFANNLESKDVAVDLGTGGGLPGLVLSCLTDCFWIFVDRSKRKCSFLSTAITELNLQNRVEVLECSAEELGNSSYRGKVKLVTARGFAAPAITAECAAPLLNGEGLFVVSEPPYGMAVESENRWPQAGLSLLGLKQKDYWHTGVAGYRSFFPENRCPDDYPRRFKRISEKPLF